MWAKGEIGQQEGVFNISQERDLIGTEGTHVKGKGHHADVSHPTEQQLDQSIMEGSYNHQESMEKSQKDVKLQMKHKRTFKRNRCRPLAGCRQQSLNSDNDVYRLWTYNRARGLRPDLGTFNKTSVIKQHNWKLIGNKQIIMGNCPITEKVWKLPPGSLKMLSNTMVYYSQSKDKMHRLSIKDHNWQQRRKKLHISSMKLLAIKNEQK